ncbi:4-carboxy-4-hydroxy-2-oxoadipate aldolase/oxaloacetate decarboxylase [Actinomadura macrotermitis]|uniref:Putative 4-hydroxy-4-methyl-2-oxoglutarate aldolase n=1 Tax=Actinomadura macrotermitis TaxID=2585200 RepID=A0A7K0C993_9ACTN|nr:4-carboxy-4-hydroxy-2-oxoadipate aldolase/oxaloacetate decarboxylase [Actinomadura macrotermitis]MQY09682.1 4-hydroxy-4-methyl-2-oxoglutarate aldolase/4-carboxy-4-hydroxy-2-oxoadipate aldolase [Actinomadura macrotermitis]
MTPIVVTGTPRAAAEDVRALGGHGVATVHEAMGREGLLDPSFRPIYPGAALAGTAVTALCHPGDNLMIHVAVEQCRDGDVLVVATTSPCTDGLFGELLATSLRARGVRGLVIGTGVRDVGPLTAMGFPVWSTAVSAQGTVKATAGSVNVPLVIGGRLVRPGDVVVADDDGVVTVPRPRAAEVAAAAQARAEREERTRAALAGGQLGLDRYELRPLLERLGVRYVPYTPEGEDG